MKRLALVACTLLAACGEPPTAADAPAPTAGRLEAVSTVAPVADSARAEPPSEVPPVEAPTAPTAEEADRDGRFALLIGIDDYPGRDADLPSGAVDLRAMRRLLVETYGYRPEHVLTLQDGRATRGAIRRAIRDHLGRADASALLYFSGHGVRLDENTGRADAERDRRDEAVYVWADDGRRGSLVADDEVGAWAGALGARHVLVVLDACHSGTGARGDGGAPAKEVPLKWIEGRLDPAAPWRRPPTAARRPVVLLAATRDDEQAYAGEDGAPSLFTGVLTDVLAAAPPDLPLADAMRTVVARVRVLSRNIGDEHTPQLEGDAGHAVGDVLPRAP